jgi:hypothetical protein
LLHSMVRLRLKIQIEEKTKGKKWLL